MFPTSELIGLAITRLITSLRLVNFINSISLSRGISRRGNFYALLRPQTTTMEQLEVILPIPEHRVSADPLERGVMEGGAMRS